MYLRHFLLLLLLACASFAVHAQPFSLKGRIQDTATGNSMEHASVVLLHAADSVLTGFARADTVGSFRVAADSAGNYLLLISYPGYAVFSDAVRLEKAETELGTIALTSREHLIKEVVIKSRMAAIKVVGDTTEYAADSFKVAEGATVEELLKKLPGIVVDKSGKITAQGQTVQKIYVDGDEFFSDDPAVVTKNLQSKAVSSVQVYDKKTESAAFTGIDDGIREKVINLKLKDSMKRGYFGKVEAGGGTDHFYQNQGMINAFKGKRKVAAYSILSTTKQTGLDWNDAGKYGGTDNSWNFNEETGSWQREDWSELQTRYNGSGLPKVIAGGGFYGNQWDEGKKLLNSSYKAQQLDINQSGDNLTQYLLPDSSYYTRQHLDRFTQTTNQNLGGKYTWKIDSLKTILITASGSMLSNRKRERFRTVTFDEEQNPVNTNDRINDIDGTKKDLKATLSWQQKFRKKGRTVMADATTVGSNTEADALFRSQNNYLRTAGSDSTFQHKTTNDKQWSLGGNVNYTEPLSGKFFLVTNYGLGLIANHSQRFSYNYLPGTADFSNAADSLYSSDYDYRIQTHKAGLTLRYVTPKITMGLGGRAFYTHYLQTDNFLHPGTAMNRNYLNWAPQANFTWKRSRMESLNLQYSGNTRQPSIEQLQPFRQNNDPLNIAIGNPNLKQEFSHNISLTYNDYKALSGTYTYLNANLGMVKDAINTAQNIDALGRRTYQYINSGDNINIWSYFGRGTKLKKADLDVNFNGNINHNTYHGFVNGQDNKTASTYYSLGFEVNKDWDKDDKMTHEISFSISGNYQQNRSSLTSTVPDFKSMTIDLSTSNKLPWKLRLVNEVQANIRQRLSEADTRYNTVVWNAYLSRKILKNDASEIRLSVFDLLKQNIGFSRMVSSSQISQEAYLTIGRYSMLTFIWNFTHAPSGGAPEGEQ